ncbi:O-antigen ligase domain-containing protein [Mucilaginibacter sp. R11]|uniref:O-antigen ligase domain-containing protein n=2 Tax=Mucilaginibacter agri TaxID=2695265 RepID=A0A966DW80_9SPHI|nr:O-antigen ligase domain-containing protein [Mucilaginibacter agri]
MMMFIGCAIIMGYGVASGGATFGGIVVAICVAVPLIYGVVAYPKFGTVVLLLMAYFLFQLGRIGVPGPLGTVMDALQLLLLLALLVNQRREDNWALFKGPISVMILLWVAYNIIEVANPTAASRLAWVYTVRSVAILQFSYFIFLYNVRTIEFVRFLFKLWLGLAFIGALWAYKQEYIGFSDSEMAFLNTPDLIALLFINGHWRKYSIFSDPVAFSYNMVMPCILCICIIFGQFKAWKKGVAAFMILFCFVAMLYSGTRGANVLLPAALFMFAILNYNKKVLIFSCIAAFFFIVLINFPTGNQTIVRFQSAFRPNNDDSYNVRKKNQKRIQPYILGHPMGGGLGSVGEWGKKFAPGSYLGNFAPDSGYMRVAVEDGYLGLILFCTMMFVMMKTGINNFYLIKDPELKSYCLAATLIVFTYNVANFPQEALVQFPSNILFYLFCALMVITKRLDDEKQLREAQSKQLIEAAV